MSGLLPFAQSHLPIPNSNLSELSAQNSLWVRSFTRVEGNDYDSKADTSLLKLLSTDFFGWFLQQGSNLDINTLNDLVSTFFTLWSVYQISVYCVADGAFIKRPKAFADWFDPHIRFLTVVTPQMEPWKSARIFIVGSNQLNNASRFLQVASWDSKVFHFYGIESINGDPGERAWTYQGNSADAFGSNEYLGPFNGHVNGAMIMKELHKPWYHWHSNDNPYVSQCFSQEDIAAFKATPWLTGQNQSLFSGGKLKSADILENTVKDTVSNWYTTRLHNDLVETSNGKATPKTQPDNIPRWMAHFLLTTTINIDTSSFDGDQYTVPIDHFINNELLSLMYDGSLLPNPGDLSFDIDHYNRARDELGLSLLQEVDPEGVSKLPPEVRTVELKNGTLGGGKQTDKNSVTTFIVTAPGTEGIPFVIVQPSYEDAQGVYHIQNIGLGRKFPQALLPEKAFNALMMIDFCNPVYSWRRGVLFQYVPSNTSLHGAEYDFEPTFVSAIRDSNFSKDSSSPEFEFLDFYDSGKQASDYLQNITAYMEVVSGQIKKKEGLSQHLRLAESRRRLYRPLPLDEFGYTLPYALGIPLDSPFLEMTPAGRIQPIPPRGLAFLLSWTGTLWTVDPKLLPQFKDVSPSAEGDASVAKTFISKRSVQGSGCPAMRKRVSGCPALRTHSYGRRRSHDLDVIRSPTWNDQVAALFHNPYWVAKGKSAGSGWKNAMLYWNPSEPSLLHLNLTNPTSVEHNAVTIYQHLRSKSMLVTSDPREVWPEDALETFRLWANQGFRRDSTDPIVSKVIISQPVNPPEPLRIKKGLRS